MSPARTLPLRTTPTGVQPLTRVGIAAVALLLTLTIYVIGFSVDHTDAPLLPLRDPLVDLRDPLLGLHCLPDGRLSSLAAKRLFRVVADQPGPAREGQQSRVGQPRVHPRQKSSRSLFRV